MKRITAFVYDHSKLIITVVIVLNIAALASFFRFDIDTDFLSFFTEGNPRAQEYYALNDKYQSGEVITVLIEDDESLLAQENLLAVFALQQQIENIEGVSAAQGYIPPEMIAGDGVIPVDETLINTNYQALADFIQNKYFFSEQFLSADGQSGVLNVVIGMDASTDDVIKQIKSVVQDEERVRISLAGNGIIKETLLDYLKRVLFILPPFALGFMLLVFFGFIRKFKLTLLALMPAGFAALWTFGTIFWSGQELNVASVVSPLFILVMGAADGLHYLSHLKDNMAKYPDRRQLTVATLDMVGMPIFLTSITTMAGFASLVWTDVIPMRHMGIFISLGIGYAGLLSLFFLPALLSRVKLPPVEAEVKESRLTRLVLAVSRRRLPVVLVFAAVIIVSAVYMPRL